MVLGKKGLRTMRWFVPAAAAALGLGAWGPTPSRGAPEVIGLKEGHQVVGDVIAERPNVLYVDLGFDVVRIPRAQVISRGKPGAEGARVAAPERAIDADPSGFY